MASFSSNTATSSSSNHPSNIAGRELNLIASSFVKQYYTLLNKAPCYIHNFYSQSSTFIHGTVEVANEHFTEPIIGREKIQSKMEEMKLNDCRAKIKQIDCLETLAGGLVIQVIGELSNNGKPMRPFMQTFVLAPSPDEARQDGKDPSHQRAAGSIDPRRGVNLNENNASPSNNQKFFVLNSIFRYQDDGLDSESEDDVGIQANTPIERTNKAGEHAKEPRKPTYATTNAAQPPPPVNSAASAYPKNQQTSISNEVESRRADVVSGSARVVPNGTGTIDKKTETPEKSNENGKPALDQSSQQSTNSTSAAQGIQPLALISSSSATSQSKPIIATATTTTTSTPTIAAAGPRPQPASEPKTWANMVSRNAHPPSASVQSTASATKTIHPDQHQPSQQQQQQSHHQQQTQSEIQQNVQNTTNNNNNRRRHMLRKPSNKSNGGAGGSGGGSSGRSDGRGDGRGEGGSRLKNRDRPRPPPAGKPMA